MDSKQILKADLLDLIFDRRNKDYGAYELRRHYNRRIARAMMITGAVVGITLTSVAIASKWKPQAIAQQEIPDIIVHTIEDKPDLPKPELPQPKPMQQTPVKQEIYVTPRIAPDNIVEEPMATTEDLANAAISNVKTEGPEDAGIVQNINETIGEGKDIVEPPKKNDEPYASVEIQAEFVGGWEKFLLRHLNGNVPVDNNASPGIYQVVIQFVVDVDGSVSNIQPLTKVGFGMEEEAMRVLRKATKWKPAIQNGRPVKAYRKQPITFKVDTE